MRVAFTSEQEDELWDRWRRGELSRLIARELSTSPWAVRALLAKHGGVRPPSRRRSARHLTVAEREEVSRGIAAGLSSRAIAARIGRSASTVSREIACNGGTECYRAPVADDAAWERAQRPKPSRLSSNAALLAVVRERLEEDLSPEQIAVWLKRVHPDAASMRVSHETIYRTIYLAGRREPGPRPARHLRSGRSVRHARRVKQSHGRGVPRNMVSIRQRPVAVYVMWTSRARYLPDTQFYIADDGMDPTAEFVSQESGVLFDPEYSGKSVMLMKRLVEQGATGPVPLLIHTGAVGVFSGVSCSWTGGTMTHH